MPRSPRRPPEDAVKALGLPGGGLVHPRPRDSHGDEAVHQGVDVVVAVALERPAAAVKVISIEFDDDTLGPKQDIDPRDHTRTR